MSTDPIRYDILVQEALRGMVRDVLTDAAKKGLPGDHHFFITFDTTAEGVRLSDRLREQYPEEMTVVLQYQYRDLKVTDKAFEVMLSFGGVMERLYVPLDAIKSFADPSVQFVLQFEALTLPAEQDDIEAETTTTESPKPLKIPSKPQPKGQEKSQEKGQENTPDKRPPGRASVPATLLTSAPAESAEKSKDRLKLPTDKPGAEVVRLDRFRKK